ncbi:MULTISPECIES: signal protein [unclassified Streptomyces]|uniref:signal protein n=1 Tax=unclassified Streptomyces TaxID=2593676 RepID=UPI002255996C|nr:MULTISPECIES: signal protein [unclassified Streptomyces]MCX4989880.1 signal protein [Streptomyces sp. NBC_00568]MCX5004897.1 signal protein [Streptomyces sp. NBC_00638]
MKVKVARAALTGVVLAALVGCGAGNGDSRTRERETTPSSPVPPSAAGRLSSADLQSRWWTWAASEPERTNPVADQDGSSCGRNQARDVWFLAGSFGGRVKRTCSVPGGVPLAFPLVNFIGEPSDCAGFMEVAKGSAVLDGEKAETEEHRGTSVSVRGAADNPVTGSGGSFTATGCGLWVQLEPLEPGPHTLTIRGESADFSVGVDYSLDVTSP